MPTLIVTPAAALVDVATAKLHLDITEGDNSHDDKIEMLLAAATRRVENDTAMSLLTRNLQLVLDQFPSGRYVSLEFPPVSAVTAVKYIDPNGDEQTLAPTKYFQILKTSQRAKIKLKNGFSWPQTSCEPESVTIEYTAGVATANLVEEDLVHAVLLLVALLFNNKMPVAEVQNFEVPMNYDWLVGPHRVW